MNKSKLIEILGWYGTLAIVLAYALVSFDYILADSLFYQILNLSGGLGIIMVSYQKKVYQPIVLNLIWGIIALGAIIKILL